MAIDDNGFIQKVLAYTCVVIISKQQQRNQHQSKRDIIWVRYIDLSHEHGKTEIFNNK